MANNTKSTILVLAIGLIARATWVFGGVPYCSDDPDYFWQGMNCDDVVYTNHCVTKLGNGDVIGELYCPVSCDKCIDHYDTSFISLKKECFNYGEDIKAFYANTNPHGTDIIAIYPHDEVYYDTAPLLWLYLCDPSDNGYYCKSYYGEKTFNGMNGEGTWPLKLGNYQIVLKKAGKFELCRRRNHFI
jgi:hypothetical protein